MFKIPLPFGSCCRTNSDKRYESTQLQSQLPLNSLFQLVCIHMYLHTRVCMYVCVMIWSILLFLLTSAETFSLRFEHDIYHCHITNECATTTTTTQKRCKLRRKSRAESLLAKQHPLSIKTSIMTRTECKCRQCFRNTKAKNKIKLSFGHTLVRAYEICTRLRTCSCVCASVYALLGIDYRNRIVVCFRM